jgi:RNA recognition motif-containing protein
MVYSKKLPSGSWLHIARLPLGTTAEELSEFFHQHGVAIPPDSISVRDFIHNAGAFVVVSKDVAADLVNWALDGKELNGMPVHAEPQRSRNE